MMTERCLAKMLMLCEEITNKIKCQLLLLYGQILSLN